MSQAGSFTTGGGGSGVINIDGDIGSATGATITFDANTSAGPTVFFDAAGSTVDLLVTDIITGNTIVGLQGDLSLSNAETGFGHRALEGSTATGNTAVGFSALLGASGATSNYNVAIGNRAAIAPVGSANVIIGEDAAFNGAGESNIFIGQQAGANSDLTSNYNIYMNTPGPGIESNTLRIGDGTGAGLRQLSSVYISGINGVDVGSVASVVSISGDELGTTTLTAGTNISITPGANTITIASTGAASFVWSKITANQAFTANNGFICNKVGLLTLTLPATAAVGDIFEVTGINTAVGWRIAQNAGQTIYFGINNTTTGVTGYLESTQIRDSIRLVCVTTDTDFNVVSSLGNITIA